MKQKKDSYRRKAAETTAWKNPRSDFMERGFFKGWHPTETARGTGIGQHQRAGMRDYPAKTRTSSRQPSRTETVAVCPGSTSLLMPY